MRFDGITEVDSVTVEGCERAHQFVELMQGQAVKFVLVDLQENNEFLICRWNISTYWSDEDVK